MLAWLDYAWVIEIVNVLVRNKIRTRHLPPPPLPNIVRIAMHIDIYGRSLSDRDQCVPYFIRVTFS